LAATVGSVACSVSGQTFSCPLAGEPATISVLARAASAGAATNTATIAGSLSDPVAANDSATTSVTIAAAPSSGPSTAATCALAPLQGVRLALAQTIVTDLGCKDGAVEKHSSKSVAKGELISTTPAGPASVAAGTAVSFTVSSGKPVKHKHGARPKPKH
jgi:hypothetical protein